MNARPPRLILASASPRRRQLLGEAGFTFETLAPLVEEVSPVALTVSEITCWNALRKGRAVASAYPRAVVLAADTLVALDGEIIGKPVDLVDARRILGRLNGREHTVSTGVFLGHLASGRRETFAVVSRVVFKKWKSSQLDNYLRQVEPLDKAGAYAAQGQGRAIVALIIGSRSNVIGLPMEAVRAALTRFGLTPNELPRPPVLPRAAARAYRGVTPDRGTRR